MGELGFNGSRVAFGENEKVQEMGGGYGCTAMWNVFNNDDDDDNNKMASQIKDRSQVRAAYLLCAFSK